MKARKWIILGAIVAIAAVAGIAVNNLFSDVGDDALPVPIPPCYSITATGIVYHYTGTRATQHTRVWFKHPDGTEVWINTDENGRYTLYFGPCGAVTGTYKVWAQYYVQETGCYANSPVYSKYFTFPPESQVWNQNIYLGAIQCP